MNNLSPSAVRAFHIPMGRRRILQALCATAGGLWIPGAFAEALTITPRLTEGPFFPDKLPLDQDNDLIMIKDDVTPALGTITNLGGRILDKAGHPVKDAVVEIWQTDNNGCYIHTKGAGKGERDAHFQGYGKFQTAKDGGYRFRTIKPAAYPGRTRHYHFAVSVPGQDKFVTHLLFAGDPGNEEDGVFRSVKDENLRKALLADFVADEKTKELTAAWDIVPGFTPADTDPHEEGVSGKTEAAPRN